MKPNQRSNTAAFIAIKFYGLTRDLPFSFLFDRSVLSFYEKLVQSLPAPLHLYHTALKKRILRRFFTYWEERLLPGDLMHIILRKWFLTHRIETLRVRGYDQLLVLGGGYDHLAALYSNCGMNAIELDAPEMSRMKLHFIKNHGYQNRNLTLCEAFLTGDNLFEILKSEPALNPNASTVIVAEGFFDYFNQKECGFFLKDLRSFFKADCTLLSTIFALDELSGFRSAIYRNSIKLAGEELKLHLSQSAFINFLSAHGFKPEKCLGPEEMKRKVLLPHEINLPVLPGFHLVEAKRQI